MTIRNRGQAVLAADGRSLGQIAKLLAEHGCPVTRQAVRGWRIGQSTPGRANRIGLRDALGIAPEAWDLAPKPEANDPEAGPPDLDLADLHGRGVDDLQRLASDARRERNRSDLAESHRARWGSIELRALAEVESRKTAVQKILEDHACADFIHHVADLMDPLAALRFLALQADAMGNQRAADHFRSLPGELEASHPGVVERYELARDELEQAFAELQGMAA